MTWRAGMVAGLILAAFQAPLSADAQDYPRQPVPPVRGLTELPTQIIDSRQLTGLRRRLRRPGLGRPAQRVAGRVHRGAGGLAQQRGDFAGASFWFE